MSSKVKVLPSNDSYRELQSIENPNTTDNPVVSIGSHSKSCRFFCQYNTPDYKKIIGHFFLAISSVGGAGLTRRESQIQVL